MKIPFGKPYKVFDNAELRAGTAAELIDGYMDDIPYERGIYPYISRPGLRPFANHPDGKKIDGLYENLLGTIVGVTNGKVFRLNANGTTTNLTGDTVGTGLARWAEEDPTIVYLATGDTHLAKVNPVAMTVDIISSGDKPDGVSHVVFQDGYVLCNGLLSGGVSGDVNYSADEGATWEVFNNEKVADTCEALMEDWNEVYSWGGKSMETSWNDGVTPWAVRDAAFHRYGVRAKYSVVRMAGTFYWLGDYDGAPKVMRLKGRTPEPVSGPYDTLLASLTNTTQALAYQVFIKEKPFYVLTLDDNTTLAYNVSMDHWARWRYFDNGQSLAYLGRCFLYSSSAAHSERQYVGDRRDTGNIYTFEGTTDNGNPIEFDLVSGQVGGDERVPVGRMLFVCKRGSTTGGPSSFYWSHRDDGKPGFSAQREVSLGSASDTELFSYLNRAGSYRKRQHRIQHNNPNTDFVFVYADES